MFPFLIIFMTKKKKKMFENGMMGREQKYKQDYVSQGPKYKQELLQDGKGMTALV